MRTAPIVCPEESPQCARRRIPLPGLDAPTPVRGQGLQPYGALTLFFRWRKKSVQKKASGTATPEAARPASRRGLRPAVAPSGLSSSSVRFAHPPGKSPLLPILTAGLAMSRAAEVARLRLQSCALGARLFPPSKWAGLFPSAAYRRSASPQLAVGRLTPCGLRYSDAAGRLCRNDEWALFPVRSWRGACLPLAGWDASLYLGIFCNAKSQREIKITLAFLASREARRRAAVASRPTGMSPEHPARLRRAVRG